MIWDSSTGLTPDDFDTIIEAYFEAFKSQMINSLAWRLTPLSLVMNTKCFMLVRKSI